MPITIRMAHMTLVHVEKRDLQYWLKAEPI